MILFRLIIVISMNLFYCSVGINLFIYVYVKKLENCIKFEKSLITIFELHLFYILLMSFNPLQYLNAVIVIVPVLVPIFLSFFWLSLFQTLKTYSFQLYENVQIMCKVFMLFIYE